MGGGSDYIRGSDKVRGSDNISLKG